MQIGMEPLVIDWAKEGRTKDGANNSAYLCLLQFLSQLCNIFFS